MEEKINGEEDEEESAKFKTIVARQAVHVLRISSNNIRDFTLKVQQGAKFTQEEVVQSQNDTVAAFYMSMLLSDDLKHKKFKKNKVK